MNGKGLLMFQLLVWLMRAIGELSTILGFLGCLISFLAAIKIGTAEIDQIRSSSAWLFSFFSVAMSVLLIRDKWLSTVAENNTAEIERLAECVAGLSNENGKLSERLRNLESK